MKTNYQRGFAPIIIVIVVLVILGGGAVYYYQKSRVDLKSPPVVSPDNLVNNPVVPEPTADEPETQTTTVAPPQTLGPKEVYLNMKAEFASVQTYADMEVYIRQYGSQNQIAKLAEAQNAPAAFRESLVSLMRSSIPPAQEITTIQENINGSTATLTVSSTKPNTAGTVTMVLENGQWKMEKESWKTSR